MEFNVLIVDDEPIICHGLRHTVPWEELGINVVGEAYDGEEALSLLDQLEVDLILSDVKMPIMDGLELAEHIFTHYPYIRMIMISGYDEFEYAKRAIRLGVKDYLLKPVDIDELIEIVSNIKEEVMRDREKEWRMRANQLLSSIVMGQEISLNEDSLKSIIGKYQLIGSAIENYSKTVHPLTNEKEQKVKKQWMNLIEFELTQKKCFCTSLFVGKNLLVTMCKMNDHFTDIKEMLKKVEKKLSYPMFFCVSDSFSDTVELKKQYDKLLDGMKTLPFQNEKIISLKNIQINLRSPALPAEFVQKIKQCNYGEINEVEIVVEEMFEYFKNEHYFLEDVVSVLKKLEMNLFEWFRHKPKLRLFGEIDVTIYNSYAQIKELFLDDLKDCFSYQVFATQFEQRRLIEKAISYIHENYQKDIKAMDVAAYINVSPNYFSQLIKQATGMHFNDFLHEVRIQQAKKLLTETNYRIFEIGELVGYKDYKYFVHIFKKLTSIPPSKYRTIVSHAK
ncbi:two-component system response regulator YesN [Anoxybacillus tepidamans]|uniref:Two-component system response regulator YesN n=1 Tax=Anoxybacteroides tepidamans TaxID=265948 RepID=A0A7W8ISC2_9BACL|nr:response regulator [Anoxybacillus tepidamans]MBB5325744.1 two-component system response regulator YesN [Anoxybacillus tepidamans]